MLYDNPLVPVLDHIARTVVVPRFNALDGDSGSGGHAAKEDFDEEASEGRSGTKQKFRDDEENEWLGSDRDGEDTEDTGESD
ncbi:Hypothetical predicted protein, partial [Olea europaea subsp. europaea]